jgi:hypothetical protein
MNSNNKSKNNGQIKKLLHKAIKQIQYKNWRIKIYMCSEGFWAECYNEIKYSHETRGVFIFTTYYPNQKLALNRAKSEIDLIEKRKGKE